MSASPPGWQGFVRRNLPPLIVGVAALVAIVGGLIVIVDRVRDDDDEPRVVRVDQDSAASPSDAFGGDLDRLLEGLLEGRPALGVSVTEEDGRVIVEEVLPGSPAAAAGIEVGDEIRDVNGERVRSIEDLREAVASAQAGDEYEVELRRDGDDLTLTVQREGVTSDALAVLLQAFLSRGLDLDDFRFEGFEFDRDGQGRQFTPNPDPFSQFRLQPTLGVSVVQTSEGLLVLAVEPGSVADEAGLRADDIILAANGVRTFTIDDLRSAIPALGTDGRAPSAGVETVELLILRDGREHRLRSQFRVEALPQFAPGQAPRDAPAPPDPRVEQLLEELAELRAFIESGAFVGELEERLSHRLEAFIEGALEAARDDLARETDARDDPPPAIAAEDLDVFRGTVQLLTDAQIVLGGSLGPIAFELRDDTAVIGAAPRVGGVSTVVSNREREAILVLTPS